MAASFLEGIPLVGGMFSAANQSKAAKNAAKKFQEMDTNLFKPLGGDIQKYTGDESNMNAIQRNAVQSMKARAQSGFTDAERAQMQGFNTQTNAQTRGARENLLSNARMQGSLTSGGTLGAALAANEAGGMQKQQNQLGQASQASKNAFAANQGMLDYDTQQRAQRFANDLQLAQARANLQSGGNVFNYNSSQDQRAAQAANRQQNTDILSSLIAVL